MSESEGPPPASASQWFHEHVQPHEPLLRAYLQKQFPTLLDVDDVVQESHLRMLQAREKGGIASVKAYLFAVARNIAVGVFRRRKRTTLLPLEAIEDWRLVESEVPVAESASLRQEVALATEAIDALPARCREIVALRVLHGLDHREVAERLGLSEPTVRVQVARGMKKCAEFLRQRGVNRGSS